jgi:hypothetical protein
LEKCLKISKIRFLKEILDFLRRMKNLENIPEYYFSPHGIFKINRLFKGHVLKLPFYLGK